MSSQELKRFAASCADFGNRAADESGFVPLHRLASILRAEVNFRPMLVEGIIAKPKGSGTWKVLIDSDTHPVTAEAFAAEDRTKPLSARLRNTVAHELLHTLSFRTEEFGLSLELREKETRADAVRRFEGETEGFSPFFLVSQQALEQELTTTGLNIESACSWRDRWSLSREIVISRFVLMQHLPEFRLKYHASISNVALCLGEWTGAESASIMEWPLFYSFENGIAPEFIVQVRGKGKPRLQDVFTDPEFHLNGGARPSAFAEVLAGTTHNPRSDRLTVSVSVENVPRRKNEQFFAVVRTEQPK